ncbi:MAG: VWA domain-containing protein, partial [Propionibacteriales bacterium]|nr:VWA domain-containing protein [Propionibacteriales bacterium]
MSRSRAPFWRCRPALAVLLAAILAIVPAARAEAAPSRPTAVPAPTGNEAVITVKVAGDRTGATSTKGLAGVTLQLFDGTSAPTTPVSGAWATCVSDAEGDCSFVVPDTQFRGANREKQFWVKQTAAPSGWYANNDLVTGSADDQGASPYAFRTGTRLRAGATYRSTVNFMGNNTSLTSRTASSGAWQNSRSNPQLETSCTSGLKVALVLDLSGSIEEAGATQTLRDSAKGFVDALSGTGSSLGLYTFASTAPKSNVSSGMNHPMRPVDGNVAAIKDDIQAYTATGGTNWDQGLWQVANADQDYDLAVVVTDGLPTFYGPSTDGPGNYTRFTEAEQAIASANALKAKGTRTIALGVGAGLAGDASNLRSISGPTRYASGTSANEADYFQADWNELASLLETLAKGATCQAGVTVSKRAVAADGSSASSAGWEFTTTVTDGPGTVSSPAAKTTTNQGSVDWKVGYTSPDASGTTVRITETARAAWDLDSATCTINDKPATFSRDGNAIDVKDVGVGDQVACEVINTERPNLADLKISKTATPSYDRDYDWEITKDVDRNSATVPEGDQASFAYSVTATPSAAQDSNFSVTGTITVTNPNPVPFTDVTVDDQLPGATCSVDGGTGLTIPANGKRELTYTCTVNEGTPTTSDTNTATATWSSADHRGTTGTASGTRAVDFAQVTPDTTDEQVTVTDDQFDLSTLEGGNVVTATAGPRTFQYSKQFTSDPGACSPYDNIAELRDDEKSKTAKQTVTVCTGADLSVTKNVVTSFDRSYGFDLTKSVDSTTVNVDPTTGKAMVDWTVRVTELASTDANWAMTGQITVTNPNDFADVTAAVSDSVDVGGGASCRVDGGENVMVPKGGTAVVDYRCTFTSQPSYEGVNTATVTWDAAASSTPTGTASGQAAVRADEWSQTPINKTVQVFDDKTDTDGEPALLGTVTWTEEGRVTAFTYRQELTAEPGKCVVYTNTATLVGDASAVVDRESAEATACAPQWDLTKVSDPASGSKVKPGDVITYTVAATPRGEGAADNVVITDDLSGVLDDATMDAASIETS